MKRDDEKDHWALDRRIPVVVVIGLLAQAGAIIWWGAQTDTRLTIIETQAIEARAAMRDLDNRGSRAFEMFVAATNQRMQNMDRSLGNMNRLLEYLVRREEPSERTEE